MSAKHTPGPWIADLEEGQFGVFEPTTGEEICSLPQLRPSWEPPKSLLAKVKANAALIAAAPELLEELKDSTDLLNALLGAMPPALQKKWPSITARAAKRIESSRAAIAKAEGSR